MATPISPIKNADVTRCRLVNHYKQVASGCLICHSRQAFQVHMQISRLINLEAAMLGTGRLSLEIKKMTDDLGVGMSTLNKWITTH